MLVGMAAILPPMNISITNTIYTSLLVRLEGNPFVFAMEKKHLIIIRSWIFPNFLNMGQFTHIILLPVF